MAVRNIKSVGNPKPIPIYHACPPSDAAILKVTVMTASGEIDITESIEKATFNLGVNSDVGDFNITILDQLKTYYNQINNFDDVYVYADYADVATTRRFRFKIENRNFSDFRTKLSGRGIGMIFLTKNIIYQSLDSNGNLTEKTKYQVLTEIISGRGSPGSADYYVGNFPEITDLSHIEIDNTLVKVNYSETPFMQIIEELCGNSHYFYLDKDLVPYYLTKGSVENPSEAIVDGNLVYVEDNSKDSENVYTRVRVYGKSEDGVVIIATADIGTSNTNGIPKDYVIKDNSIINFDQAKNLAEFKAQELRDHKQIGNITSILLPTLNQGEALFIGLSEEGVVPQYYNISHFSINIDNNGDYPFTTTVIIEGGRTKVSNIIKESIQTTNSLADTENAYGLDFCRIIDFNSQTGTFTNTMRSSDGSISGGYYLIVSSGSQGSWESDVYTLDQIPTRLYFRMIGENLVTSSTTTTSMLYYSVDGGTTWNPNYGIANLDSKDLKIKIYLNQSTAKVKKVAMYYSY